MRAIERAVFMMLVGSFGCAEHGVTSSASVKAHELVRVEVDGRASSMYAFSCPWFPESAEFVNLSSHAIRVLEIEMSLRHAQGAGNTEAPSVAQTIAVDVTLAPYGRAKIGFWGPTPDGRGAQTTVRLQGCKVTVPPHISKAEFVD